MVADNNCCGHEEEEEEEADEEEEDDENTLERLVGVFDELMRRSSQFVSKSNQ